MPNSIKDLATRHRQDGGRDDVLYPAEDTGGGAPEAEEEPEEAREVRAPPIPVTLSRAEVLQHRLKHHPYRSWCPHCVRGKGREDKHMRSTQKDQ